LFVISAVAIGA